MDTQKLKTALEAQWEENPLQVIIVASLAITATAKLVDSLSSIASRRAYARRFG